MPKSSSQNFIIYIALILNAQSTRYNNFHLLSDGESPCQKHLNDANAKSSQGVIGHFIPTCHADGHYDRVQCHGSTGYCWCADMDGNERPNTRIRGQPNCNLNGKFA